MRICSAVCIVVVLWLGGARPGLAQSTADAYFHRAAREYVAGNTEVALRTVKQGLEVEPSNPKLTALLETVQSKRRSQRRNDGSPTSPETSSSSSSTTGSSNESSDPGDPSANGERGARQGDSQSSGSDPSAPVPADSQLEDARPGVRGSGIPLDTLSRSQAERLLRALEGQERKLLRQLQIRSTEPQTVEKDW